MDSSTVLFYGQDERHLKSRDHDDHAIPLRKHPTSAEVPKSTKQKAVLRQICRRYLSRILPTVDP